MYVSSVMLFFLDLSFLLLDITGPGDMIDDSPLTFLPDFPKNLIALEQLKVSFHLGKSSS